jgi:V/A-type H+-transporting ATPase subunit I
MIVKMSKVEIVGPKDLLQDVISLLRDMGIFQIEPATVGLIEKGQEEHVRSLSLDEKTLFERLFLEDLRLKIDELLSYLPKTPTRKSYFEPLSVIDSIGKIVQTHLEQVRGLCASRESLQKELSELSRYEVFLDAVASLLETSKDVPDLDFIGFTIEEPEMLPHLREAISRITDWRYELMTEDAADGTLVGLITVEKEISDKVKKSLSEEHVPELAFPQSFSGLTFSEKIAYVTDRLSAITRELRRIDSEIEQFLQRWGPIYRKVREWLDDRMSMLTAIASVFETRMCFFINGWMPSGDVPAVRERLIGSFKGEVALEEGKILEDDIERVPIVLRNPPYFRPFELFTRLLPLPAYTSYDPTPFVGIFFPIFFGMILGDGGYGLFLLGLCFIGLKRFRKNRMICDGVRILLFSSLYAIFFGVLYGEFFGDLPHRLFGLEPICVERRTALIPMIFFTLAVGTAHVLLGLLLGVMTALRKKTRKEAFYKLLSIATIIGLLTVVASLSGVLPLGITRPVIIVILFLTPLLFFTGGILAPLELLKSIGNIISYVRIMAIGLTSVLLAFVANRLVGLIGDVAIGIIVAGLLHMLNIILGVFSPTIHSLRLHYVEFFGKFLEHGGRKFEPLKKAQ